MSTRSLTKFYQTEKDYNEGKPFCCVYQQYDGYPSVRGYETAKYLAPGTFADHCNKRELNRVFAGMGCLAASFIANFKETTGTLYVEPPDALDESYTYHIFPAETTNHIMITAFASWNDDEFLYSAEASAFAIWAKAQED